MLRRKRVNPVWLLSVEEIAAKYDFHPNTIRAWVNQDHLRHFRKGRGGKIFIREDDVKDFITKNYEFGE
jgi:excisionase family DNA binding protein